MGPGSARTGSAAQDRVQDVEHLADAGLAIGEAQLQHGAVVLAQHLGVAVGLGGDQLAEGEVAARDVQVVSEAAVICRNEPTGVPPLWN